MDKSTISEVMRAMGKKGAKARWKKVSPDERAQWAQKMNEARKRKVGKLAKSLVE